MAKAIAYETHVHNVRYPFPCILCRPSLQPRALHNHFATSLQPLHGSVNHLIHDFLCRLPLVRDSGDFAHQEGSCVVHGVVIDVVAEGLEVVFDGDCAFGSELLDLRCAVLFPVLDVRVVADPEGTTLVENIVSKRSECDFRMTLTVKMMVRTLSSKPDVLTASWCAFDAPASSDSTNLVPIHTALAPSMRAAARD